MTSVCVLVLQRASTLSVVEERCSFQRLSEAARSFSSLPLFISLNVVIMRLTAIDTFCSTASPLLEARALVRIQKGTQKERLCLFTFQLFFSHLPVTFLRPLASLCPGLVGTAPCTFCSCPQQPATHHPRALRAFPASLPPISAARGLHLPPL